MVIRRLITALFAAALVVFLQGCGFALPVTNAPLAATGSTAAPGIGAEAATPLAPPAIKIITATTFLPTATARRAATSTMTVLQDGGCLVGTWQVSNLPAAIEQSLTDEQSGLAAAKVEGESLYDFGPGGNMKLTFNHLAVTFNGTVEQRPVSAVESLDGSGTARYQVDPANGDVLLSEFGGEGIQFTLAINGQTLAEGSLPVWQAFPAGQAGGSGAAGPTAVVHSSRTEVSCAGDELTLHELDPAAGPEVKLTRVH